MKLCSAALLLCLAIEVPADEVDDLIKAEMKTRNIPGVQVLITRADRVIKQAAYGVASLELNVPLTNDHVMESGSIGKSFTATVILQLVEEGKLRLDDPLGVRIDSCPEAWRPITIRQLLNQVSGIPDYALVPGLGLIENWTDAQWFERMRVLPMEFQTGKSFAYSNSNYLLLGLVAEKVERKPIMTLVRERILDKVGLKKSYVSQGLPIIPMRASGYLRNGQTLLNGPEIPTIHGDGSLINSCQDLAAFERALRLGNLLKPETVQQMQTSHQLPSGRKTGYGYGWFVRDVNKVRLVSHGGNTAGFFASLFRVPSADLTIVLMGNVNDLPGDPIAQRIAELYVPELKPRKLTEQPDPDPKRTVKLLDCLKALASGTPKDELLDPEYVARLKSGRGRMIMSGLSRYREVKEIKFLEAEPDDPDTVVRYRASVGGRTFIVSFVVSKEGKVYSIGQRAE